MRLSRVLRSDFPIGDGGLFYLMIQELQANQYRLPAYTAYNAAGIPFAYPPLGLYLAGLVAGLTHQPLIEVMHFLPVAFNLLTIPAFIGLSRAMLPSKAAANWAGLAFALLPYSFFWWFMGGGVTRAPGFLFAVLALWSGYLLYTRRQARYIWPTMAAAGCTVSSHPSMAFLLAYSLGFFFLAYGLHRRGVLHSLLVAGGTLALSAPWWATAIARYGVAPLLSAGGTGTTPRAGLGALGTLLVTVEPYFPLLGGLALLGLLVALKKRHLALPGWLLLSFLLDARGALGAGTVPLALLAGLGIDSVVAPWLRRDGQSRAAKGLALAVAAYVILYATLGAATGWSEKLRGLSPGEREAMAWVAGNTPPGGRFLVVSPGEESIDYTAEWFPVLAQRVSVTTYQGYEWLGSDVFRCRMDWHAWAELYGARGAESLESWAEQEGLSFDYVYVSKGGSGRKDVEPEVRRWAWRNALACDSRYALAYDGPGALIFRRAGQ